MIPVAYLLGSVPFGLIAGRVLRGVDVRDHGSGSTGMTNVLRTVNSPAAGIVLLLDMGKAVLAVVLARVFSDSAGVQVAAALSVLIGHNWPVFSGFRGGKGTAPGWGGLLILSPISGLVASILGAGATALSRSVSVGSLIGAASGSAVLVVRSLGGAEPPAYLWYGIIGTAMIVVSHRGNIRRLARGEERKIGQPAEASETQPKSGRGKGWPGSA